MTNDIHYHDNQSIKRSTEKNFRWPPGNWLDLHVGEGKINLICHHNLLEWYITEVKKKKIVSIIALSSWCSRVTAHLPALKSQTLTVLSALALARTFLKFIRSHQHWSNKWKESERCSHLSWNQNTPHHCIPCKTKHRFLMAAPLVFCLHITCGMNSSAKIWRKECPNRAEAYVGHTIIRM